jgi:hypothetical protein
MIEKFPDRIESTSVFQETGKYRDSIWFVQATTRGKYIGPLSLDRLCFSNGPVNLVASLFRTFIDGKEKTLTRVQNGNISLLFRKPLLVLENNEAFLYCNICGHVFF